MNKTIDTNINNDLILRERLAIQRTNMANQTTLLSFVRTSLYFLIAGLSIHGFFKLELLIYLEILLFTCSLLIFVFGLYNYKKNKKIIIQSEIHIGNYKHDYKNKI
jgi:putative membrane protein